MPNNSTSPKQHKLPPYSWLAANADRLGFTPITEERWEYEGVTWPGNSPRVPHYTPRGEDK